MSKIKTQNPCRPFEAGILPDNYVSYTRKKHQQDDDDDDVDDDDDDDDDYDDDGIQRCFSLNSSHDFI